MNKLALSAFMIAGLAQATGCIITSDDPDPEYGFFDVSWTMEGGCPTNGLATITSVNTSTQQVFTDDNFPCSDGLATTDGLPLGSYTVKVEILDGTAVAGTSDPQTSSLTFAGERPGLAFAVTTVGAFGFFDVTWTTQGSCTTDGLATIISKDKTSQQEFTDVFPCAAGLGTTNGLPLAEYDVWVELSDSTGNEVIAQSGSQTGSLAVSGDRPSLAFVLDTGVFGFTWSFSGTATNCATAGADGVDIIATMANTTQAWVTIHDCAPGSATSDPLFLGTYTMVVDLLNGDDPLGTSAPREGTLTVVDALVDLGNFEFAFN